MNTLVRLFLAFLFWVFLPLLASAMVVVGIHDLWEIAELSTDGEPTQATIVSLDFRVSYEDGQRETPVRAGLPCGWS